MTDESIDRRRVLRILAASAAACASSAEAGPAETYEWTGIALGADARLVLVGGDRERARRAVDRCCAEVARLESVFSLYQASSELCRLNHDGLLRDPSLDMVRLLRTCEDVHRATQGRFDPTVQPLWRYYAELSNADASERRPDQATIAALLNRAGMPRVEIAADRITLGEGMALTLNGIAQGYITDRVAELLSDAGWTRVLVDMGESRVLGEEPFRVRVPETGVEVPVASAALATSSGDALRFPGLPEVSHILDPYRGDTPRHWKAVTVSHASATIADALSTALFLAPPPEFDRILARFPGARAWQKSAG